MALTVQSSAAEHDYRHLVQDDRIHGSLYTDPAVFADEMQRIFTDGWVFVGHESEVPEVGDWVSRRLGTEPVLMVRNRDGAISVVANRCAHRGTTLCPQNDGNNRNFRCAYHGWTYDLDGTLLGVPGPKGFHKDTAELGLDRPGQVDDYRGFVFANRSGTAGPLSDHLGAGGTDLIDRTSDMSPTGSVRLSAGWIGQRIDSNWKMWPESDNDGYHLNFTHASMARAVPDTYYDEIVMTGEDASASVTRAYDGGHVELDFRRSYSTELAWLGTKRDKVADYCDALERAYGADRAKTIMWDGPPHALVFPNLFLAEMNIARIEPVAPGVTVHHHTPLLVEGTDESVNQRLVLQSEAAMGPASFFLTDDAVIAERMHRAFEGAAAGDDGWADLSRGIEREHVEHGQRWSDITDETTNRGFWHHYRDVMARVAVDSPNGHA